VGIPADFYAQQPGASFCTEGIVVSDGAQIRVLVGLLPDGDYGITLIGPDGSTILTGSGLAANTVQAFNILAGTITADKLAAVLLLASTIETADSGARVMIDGAGIRCYAADETLLVNIPTDGISPVYIAAQVQASSLTVPGAAEFDGTVSLAPTSVTTLEAGVQSPNAAPTVAQGLATPQLLDATPGWNSTGAGYVDPVGGSDGATPCYVQVQSQGHNPTNFRVAEWTLASYALNQTTSLSTAFTNEEGAGGITRIGSTWYVTFESGALTRVSLRAFDRSTGTNTLTIVLSGTYFFFTAETPAMFPIATDGASLYVMGTHTSSLNAWVVAFDTSLGFISGTSLTLPSAPGGAASLFISNFAIANDGDGNGTTWWADMSWDTSTSYNIYQFTIATGAVIANTSWPGMVFSTVPGGLFWDGNNWWEYEISSSYLQEYSNITQTGTMVAWISYAWYLSTGGTNETVVSPRFKITITKRRQINVTTAPIPTGADSVRVYMTFSATDPGPTHYHLQTTDALTAHILTSYSAAGAADGGGTPFPGGTGAQILNANGDVLLRGDFAPRLRYVALGAAYFDAFTGTTGAAIAQAHCAEMTGVPIGTVAVQIVMICTVSVANAGNYVGALDYGGTAFAVMASGASVAGYENGRPAGLAYTGGTNNRQIDYIVGRGGGNVTYTGRVVGYLTKF
jgi:hypothetical protein